jgi:hypothetical protein
MALSKELAASKPIPSTSTTAIIAYSVANYAVANNVERDAIVG